MTRYADRLLADGERVALRGRQHVLATVVEGRMAWLIFVASLILVVLVTQLAPNTPELVRQIFSWTGLALLLIGLAWLIYIYVEWYNQDYLVTNRRVLKVEGILSKRSADSSLEKINDAVLQQSVLGRMLGYGDLDILTANEESADRYRMLAEAQQFKRTMLDEKHKLEQDVFQIPAPPLRAAAAAPAASLDTGAAMSTHAPAAPATASRQMSSDEITSALGNLADLRDRGAISPEEYDAKKRELLSRL